MAASKSLSHLNFPCLSCNRMHREHFLPNKSDPDTGVCSLCGNFVNLKGARSAGASVNAQINAVSEALRDEDQSYRAEVPMDVILARLMDDAERLNPKYRSSAFYLQNREVFVEWMFDLAEKLRVQPETFHHSVNMFDAYLLRSNSSQHLASLTHFQNQSKHNIITLIALTCLFISAKYLEKTYPGINQLLNYIGIPYCYEEFVAQEKDMLETLGWEL